MKSYELEKRVELYIDRYTMIREGDHVLVGVSGGADSVCLLAMLVHCKQHRTFQISVLHVNHGVRAEAKEDAAYVEQLCNAWEIPYYLEQVDMIGYAKEHGLSEEEAGRNLRYQLFSQYMERLECDSIAVAHHQNDRAETMLFHLFRGTGIQGLASIRPVRDQIIRPLLCMSREEIEFYLQEKQISYCEDSTNASDAFSRNRIRHHIIPEANHISEQAIRHMSETAEQLLEIHQYVERQAMLAMKECVSIEEEHVCIYLPAFFTQEEVIQKRILLLVLEHMTPHRKDITAAHIGGLRKLMDAAGSATMQLPYQLVARKEYQHLYIQKDTLADSSTEQKREKETDIVLIKEEKNLESTPWENMECYREESPSQVISIEGLGTLSYQMICEQKRVEEIRQNITDNRYTKYFDYDKIKGVVVVRTRRTGDYFICDQNHHRKSVKSYMIDEKIPQNDRDKIWLIAEGDHVLWIPGYRISEYYKVDQNTRCILQIQVQ